MAISEGQSQDCHCFLPADVVSPTLEWSELGFAGFRNSLLASGIMSDTGGVEKSHS